MIHVPPRPGGPRLTARTLATLVTTCVVIATVVVSVGSGAPAAASAAAPTITPLGTLPNPPVNGKDALYAWGAATLPDGSVAIGDIWNGRVVRYSATGKALGVLFTLPNGQNPYGLAVDPNDWTIYVGASSCCWVLRYVRNPATGKYSQGASIVNDNLRYPSRVAVRGDGWVYVSDMLLGQIFVYDRAGALRFTIGTKGSDPGQLKQPRAMAFDGNGRLYVVDAFNERVSVFTKTGRFLFAFGSRGTTRGRFAGTDLRGLSIDRAHGRIYVVDGTSGYIDKFGLNGTFLTRFGGPGGRRGVTVCCSTPLGKFQDGGRESTIDGKGHLWVADMPAFRAQVFSSKGTALFQVGTPNVFPSVGGFNYPEGVAVDSDGNVIVSDTRNFRIQKLNASGKFLWQIGLRGRFSGYSLNYTRGVNADPRNGSIVIADNFSSQIKKYSASGVWRWTIAGKQGSGPGQVDHPSQAAVGPDGTIYVADSFNERIDVFDSKGHYLRMINSGPGFTMKDPRGVTVDPSNGDLYVSDYAAHSVFHLKNNGSWVATIGSSGPALKNPSQSALDGAFLFVTDPTSRSIRVYDTTSGQYATSISAPRPDGISISKTGILYVSELSTGHVERWSIS